MNKLGVERRLYTAGENKAMLDPFVPEDPVAISHLQTMLGDIHQQFIDAVKTGRGERLKDDAQLFTGLVWTGEESVRLGLIDGLGSTRYVAEQLIGAEDMVDYTLRSSWIDRVLTQVGVGFGQGLQRVLGDQLNLH
jgi:protease-4